MDQLCTSCKRRTTNMPGSTTFSCPKCSDHVIVRCFDCRRQAVKYTCPGCAFDGPN